MSNPAPIQRIGDAPSLESLESLVERRVSLRADLEYIQGEIDAVDSQLLEALEPGTHDVGDAKVQVRESRRTDYAAVAKAYSAEEFPQLYKSGIDSAAVKREFAPSALEQFVKLGKRSVVIS